MKIILIATLATSISLTALAQSDSVNLPLKGRIVSYETALPVQHRKAKDISAESAKWITETFKEIKEPKPATKITDGKVDGTGIIKVTINDGGDYYWLKFSITMRVTDSTAIFRAFDFYEKPTFPGVTNDWSKIEYRWRDFRKGKPWSPGDAKLFAGVDAGVRSLTKSFGEVVGGSK